MPATTMRIGAQWIVCSGPVAYSELDRKEHDVIPTPSMIDGVRTRSRSKSLNAKKNEDDVARVIVRATAVMK